MNFCHMKKYLYPAVIGALLMANGSIEARTFFLRAGITNMVMPDGRSIEMWGFALENSFGARSGMIQVPGPELRIPVGDPVLRIIVTNELPVPVSVVIPNLNTPDVWVNGNKVGVQPARFTDAEGRSRARSFTLETPPHNTVMYDYRWLSVTPGTYLYHSGSHPAVQVQMGLYGCAYKQAANNFVYSGVPFDSQKTILFSDIDPDLHDAVSSGNYGPGKAMTSTIESKPKYFLVNGKAFSGNPWIPTDTFEVGKQIWIRLLNAGMDTKIPVINNNEVKLVAEDGRLYPYPTVSSAITLPALKTLDAIWEPSNPGVFPLYDRRLGLVSGNMDGASIGGGALTYLGVTQKYSNTNRINIGSSVGPASIYPSEITVANSQGSVYSVTVTLNTTSHGAMRNIDIALRSPDGKLIYLTSDGGASWTNATVTFDDNALYKIPSNQIFPAGSYTYKPRNMTVEADPFPPTLLGDAPLSTFKNSPANGTWSLFVYSDAAGFTGALKGGWSLSLLSTP